MLDPSPLILFTLAGIAAALASLGWLRAEVARVILLETQTAAAPRRVRLGLAFLYQTHGADGGSSLLQRWEMIREQGEVGDFVLIHNALNQAAARIQHDSPTAPSP